MREVIIAKLQRRRASLSEGESQALLSMLLFLEISSLLVAFETVRSEAA